MAVNNYPIYIISKGRADSRLTAKALDELGLPYRIVIESPEYDDYAEHIEDSKILVLPFHDLGKGSIPARNWVWQHSIKEGHKRHWIMDDNIKEFWRLNRNAKVKLANPIFMKLVEDFVDRYENIAMAGLNYDYFCPTNQKKAAYTMNTRIYSCILLSNDLTHRWRGKYNEDTDLSIRILKDGWCTMLFNTFLAGKVTTQVMKGGNTDHVYIDGDNRMKFAQSLADQHPDVAKVVWRFNRWHHLVDYSPFSKNKLIKKNIYIPEGINEHGMKLCDQ